MDDDGPDLTALVGSRICHDLISPLGAVDNGVELLGLSNNRSGRGELELIAESVGAAKARIAVFRVAFGAADAGDMLGAADLHALSEGLSDGGRLRMAWQPATALPRPTVKIATLLTMCLASALPAGGTVTVEAGDTALALHATGPRITADPERWDDLNHARARSDIAPSLVHFALAAQELRRQGRRMTMTATEGSMRVEC